MWMLFEEGTVLNWFLLLGPSTTRIKLPHEQSSYDSCERHAKLELNSTYIKHRVNDLSTRVKQRAKRKMRTWTYETHRDGILLNSFFFPICKARPPLTICYAWTPVLAPRFSASSLSHGWVQWASQIALYTRSGGSCNFLSDGKVDWYQVLVPEWTSHNNMSVKMKSSPTMHLHLVLSDVFRICCSSWGLCKMAQKCFTCLLWNILLLGSSSESYCCSR